MLVALDALRSRHDRNELWKAFEAGQPKRREAPVEAGVGHTLGWRERGRELGFGAGIAQRYATLGQIGFSERSGYTAIGTVCNLAARLCAEAKDGQILVSSRIAEAVDAVARLEDLGNLELKGLRRPVAAFNVTEPVSGVSALA